MFGPDYKAGCPSCTSIADGFNGFANQLASRGVMLWAISRAPLTKLQAYKREKGWTFPWASSFGSDFNPDFNVFFTDEQKRKGEIVYNYQRPAPTTLEALAGKPVTKGPEANATAVGVDVATYTSEAPGMSAFALEDGVVYHTYSTYARGLDVLWGMWQWLDRAPRGRSKAGA